MKSWWDNDQVGAFWLYFLQSVFVVRRQKSSVGFRGRVGRLRASDSQPRGVWQRVLRHEPHAVLVGHVGTLAVHIEQVRRSLKDVLSDDVYCFGILVGQRIDKLSVGYRAICYLRFHRNSTFEAAGNESFDFFSVVAFATLEIFLRLCSLSRVQSEIHSLRDILVAKAGDQSLYLIEVQAQLVDV